MSNGIKAWSYSAYSTYAQCPAKLKYQKIDKLKEPQSDAMKRGEQIHKKGEDFLLGVTNTVPAEYKHFATMLEQLKELSPFAEQEWGFTSRWTQTGWMSKDTWYRCKIDAGVVYPDNTADTVDFKTGKLYETNEDQIETQALSLMCRYPHVRAVTASLWYLDSGDEVVRAFDATQKDSLKAKWEKKVGPMFADTVFAPKPNKFCNWCHFRKSNGGPCRFS